MRGTTAILAVASIFSLTACGTGDIRRAEFSTPPAPALVANAGDTVMDVRITRLPLSAIGFVGSNKELDRVLVQFAGAQGRNAVFVRHDLVMMSSGDTPPLWAPVGVASPVAGYAAAAQPITLSLAPGEVLPLEGRILTVRRADRNTLEYTLEDAQVPSTP